MKCKEAKKLIVLDHYGELEESERDRLRAHLKQCGTCAEDASLTAKVLAVIDVYEPAAKPSTDWEKAWDRVQAGIAGAPSPERARPAVGRRWAFAGAAAALVLAVGIFIGRYIITPGPQPSGIRADAATSPPPNGIRPAFAAHLEELKPIVLDYAHYAPGDRSGRDILVDEDVLRGLVLQNILLKRKIAEKDPAAADLLDDLDVVLREIVNRGAKDPEAPAQIKDLIEQRGVLFKMEIMKKI